MSGQLKPLPVTAQLNGLQQSSSDPIMVFVTFY